MHAVVSNIFEVDSDKRDSREKVSAKKLYIAELAFQAAEDAKLCFSPHNGIINRLSAAGYRFLAPHRVKKKDTDIKVSIGTARVFAKLSFIALSYT